MSAVAAEVCLRLRTAAIGRSAHLLLNLDPCPRDGRESAWLPFPRRVSGPSRPHLRSCLLAPSASPIHTSSSPRWKRTVWARGKRRVSGPRRENATAGSSLSKRETAAAVSVSGSSGASLAASSNIRLAPTPASRAAGVPSRSGASPTSSGGARGSRAGRSASGVRALRGTARSARRAAAPARTSDGGSRPHAPRTGVSGCTRAAASSSVRAARSAPVVARTMPSCSRTAASDWGSASSAGIVSGHDANAAPIFASTASHSVRRSCRASSSLPSA